MENRDNNAREELIEDIVDLLDIYEGDITIEELYETLFSDNKKDLIEKKNYLNYDLPESKNKFI